MEDILRKNIFDDKDLCKLSPDYSPSNLLLRMQMRRNMVKDTHSHGVVKSNLQRKSIKRAYDFFKINKELVDLRNGFQNINLKNQIMLKNAIKHVENMKSKNIAARIDDDDDGYEELKIGSDLYFNELTEKTTELVLCNDRDFKIIDKPKAAKVLTEVRNHKVKTLITKDNLNKCSEDIVEDVVRVQCTFLKPSTLEESKEGTDKETKYEMTDDMVIYKEQTNEVNLAPPRLSTDKHVRDLQSLLIMMAISPKSNEKEEDNNKCSPSEEITVPDELNFKELNDHGKTNPDKKVVLPAVILRTEGFTEILNITPLKIEISNKQKYILKKYVEKWRVYVNKKKEYMAQQRQATLNSFFDKLAKKKMNINHPSEPSNKAKLLAQDYSTYQHRYKVQKHIIALQKAKLEEQNRMIEELKYNKIIEASKQSVDAMKEEVRKTYYEIDRQLKPKIKCLTNELKMHEIEEPSLVLHCLKVPQFLQRMEKRAREREEKHAMIRERRKQMEEERIRLKQQQELARAEMDKEEKMKRMKELREKRKREKIENIRKKQYVEKMRALTVMADLHYEKNLMAKYGIRPLRLLMEVKRDNLEKARAHYNFQLKKNVFLHWMWYTEDMWFERNYKADDFKRKKMLRMVFEGLTQIHHEYVLKKQVAEDYYDLYVTQFGFRMFLEGIQQIRIENELKYRKATVYYNSNLLFKAFTYWRTLPALNALKREQEARKARWREKVLQVVPDYSPPDD